MASTGSENSPWQRLRGWALLIALAPLIVLIMIIALLLEPFTRPLDMTHGEVADSLRAIVDGTGGEWDLDDFTSIEIADPHLESIRIRAARIALPIDDEGMATLRALLAEAEALAGR
jgi:hypothetical protein